MKRIAFDVMGNDNGVKNGVLAALDFSDKFLDYTFILVGSKVEINKYVKESERIKIIDMPEIANKDIGARAARLTNNSMSAAINLVKDGSADAVISAGNSAIYLSMATLSLKRMNGVKRPAFMAVFPTIIKDQRFVMTDVGANLTVTPEMLMQWATLGSSFSNAVLGIENPKVNIVNIGEEDSKGPSVSKEANLELKKSKIINYKGFIEPKNLLSGKTDVAIVDGYAGNMILKTMEGTMSSLFNIIRTNLKSKLRYKIGALISKGAFTQIKEDLNYKSVALAWVVGLKKFAIKIHGNSDRESYMGAFTELSKALDNDALAKLQKEFNK
ncbi:phosphate acyltransferase PlsX [Candidatus Mycoplasma mahonii]|uniref:phosphate acyltransferase PlsX n=1 Tax=Candidatus Mycoplasma mahonii TaxID=3004105 RepID=UPI0026E9A85A|nr:phosphate acyltransferase PlsX [Candidatus Mycoplasma mahonii]WKX02725.1 phosphate acyltransferase PlsX [Candidatus Mycoplasma mahonii]